MKQIQLNHVALLVENVTNSCKFYSEVLQLEPLARPAFDFPGAWFRLGIDQELHLIGGRDREVSASNRGNHFALMVDNIDAWEHHLRPLNVMRAAKKQRPDGFWQIFITDPDGHVIELCAAPDNT